MSSLTITKPPGASFTDFMDMYWRARPTVFRVSWAVKLCHPDLYDSEMRLRARCP